MSKELDPSLVLWQHDKCHYAFALSPLGDAFFQSATARVAKDLASAKPEMEVEELDDGTTEEIETEEYRQELAAWNSKVQGEVADRLTKIMIPTCVKGVLIKQGDEHVEFNWRPVAKKYRKDHDHLGDIIDFPSDDLELFVNFVAVKDRMLSEDFATTCFYGESVAERVRSFRDRA